MTALQHPAHKKIRTRSPPVFRSHCFERGETTLRFAVHRIPRLWSPQGTMANIMHAADGVAFDLPLGGTLVTLLAKSHAGDAKTARIQCKDEGSKCGEIEGLVQPRSGVRRSASSFGPTRVLAEKEWTQRPAMSPSVQNVLEHSVWNNRLSTSHRWNE